jgi:hypothetical protein
MLTTIKSLSLLVAFLLELAVLADVGYWGFKTGTDLATRLLAGIGTPVLFGAAWAVFGAPGAPVALHGPARAILEICWFGGGVAVLAASAATLPAIVLAAVYLANTAILHLWLTTSA